MSKALVLALVVPLGLDVLIPAPADNRLTIERVELGRRLFFDPRLSIDGTVSCASCHRPERSFSGPEPIAVGVFRRTGTRNAPAIINRAYGTAFFWDGRSASLEDQVLQPIEDPNEMGFSAQAAAARVGLDTSELGKALASYVRSILSGNSPYDRFVAGDRTALSPPARAGLSIFRGKGRCSTCHFGPTLTDEEFHHTGIAWQDGRLTDDGRARVTGNPADGGAFKTPTLRDVARTEPYMHDGSLPTLEAVIDFYAAGGRPNSYLDERIRPLELNQDEKDALVAFLRSLTGELQQGWRTR